MSDTNDTPSVTQSHVAAVAAGALPWLDLPLQMQAFMAGQAQANMTLWNGLFQPNARMGNLLYGFLNGSLSADQMERFSKIIATFPEPLASLARNSSMDPQKFRALTRDPMVLTMAETYFSMLPGEGMLYDSKYNHQFLGERSDGTIEAVDPDRIITLFHQANGASNEFPRIILTSSHAKGEALDDVTKITHGIEALARDSWNTPLNIAHTDEAMTADKTLVLYSCETERSPMLNGLKLTRRLNELEILQHDGDVDRFQEISPGAQRMARLMLACMCENYYDANGQRLFDVNDRRPLNEIFTNGGARIHLRSDAHKIAQHFQLMGYSKGGNVVSDAMRFLERDLMAVDSQGKGIVRTSSQSPEDRGMLRLKDYGVRSLLHNINTASLAARELPFTDAQKQNGLQRVAFNNIHDPITRHYEYESSWNDEFYLIEGSKDKPHDPEEAMGSRHRRGYALNDERVARRMKEFFAPHYGRAAVSNLFIEDGKLKIEAAPGTTDTQLAQYGDTLVNALHAAGVPQARFEGNPFHIGTATLLEGPALAEPDLLKSVGKAFENLRANAPGLLIAQKITDEDVPSLIDKAKANVGCHAAQVIAGSKNSSTREK